MFTINTITDRKTTLTTPMILLNSKNDNVRSNGIFFVESKIKEMYYIVCYGLLGAFLALIIAWLDTKILDNRKKKSTYLKNMLLAGLVTAGIVAFIGENNLGHKTMVGGAPTIGMTYLPSIKEEIITGPPNF